MNIYYRLYILLIIITTFLFILYPFKKESEIDIVKKPLEIEKSEDVNHQPYRDFLQLDQVSVDNIVSETMNDFTYKQQFPMEYTDMEGVLTFRGGHMRDSPSFGNIGASVTKLNEKWAFTTDFDAEWGGGAGWTGQPAIIRWNKEMVNMMNVYPEFKNKELIEVIQGSLDGYVYFFEISTGKATRSPLHIDNPIKGSVSIDSRGYPLLYVGEGIPRENRIGFNLYSLIDQSLLYYQSGLDSFAFRGWGANDGSTIFKRDFDSLLLGGENGLFYNILLNTKFDKEKGTIEISPDVMKYRYAINGNYGNPHQGIENSIAAYKNIAYFADNGGSVQALDLHKMTPIWALDQTDDTDSTLVLEEVGGTPFLYSGTEVDNVGMDGNSLLRKINGLDGSLEWSVEIPIYYNKNVNGGLLSTPLIGKNDIEDLVIFTLARYNSMNTGLMIALNKNSGEEVWRWEMPFYSWSSPLDVYTINGESYILQGDSNGNMHLIKGDTGELIDKISLGSNIESSPSIFNNLMVVPTRGGRIIGVEIK